MVRKIYELSLWRLAVIVILIFYLSKNLITTTEGQSQVDQKKQNEQRALLSTGEDSACANIIAGKRRDHKKIVYISFQKQRTS